MRDIRRDGITLWGRTAQYLATARDMLNRGRRMIEAIWSRTVGALPLPGRVPHSEALIFERDGRSLKTHRGVQSEFPG